MTDPTTYIRNCGGHDPNTGRHTIDCYTPYGNRRISDNVCQRCWTAVRMQHPCSDPRTCQCSEYDWTHPMGHTEPDTLGGTDNELD